MPPSPTSFASRAAIRIQIARGTGVSAEPLPGRAPQSRSAPEAALDRALDALSDAVAIYSDAGVLRCANRAMRQVLEDEGDRGARLEIQRTLNLAREGLRDAWFPEGEEIDRREIRLREGSYSLRASRLGPGAFGAGGGILVALQKVPGGELSDLCLRERFGLSNQEVRVARLLAEGRTNEEVAGRLCISPHTARHHVGRVLSKLDVRSRTEVAVKLLSRHTPKA